MCQALLQERIREHTVEQTVAFLVPQNKDKIVEVFQASDQECIHKHESGDGTGT